MDKMKSVRIKQRSLQSLSGRYAKNITTRWLYDLRQTNPAILGMFRERDVLPYRSMLPWSGEFAGKHLTGAYYIYRLTGDERLKSESIAFADELVSTQAEDGYLGCFSKECRLTGAYSQNPAKTGETWDAWGHYHCMLGLYLWYTETKNANYLACVEKAAALFLRLFYNPQTGNKRLGEIGWTEMNFAPVHIFSLLYRQTGNKDYLDFALQIVRDFETPGNGDYIRQILSHGEFYECPKPRWESMHSIIGVADLYRATGDTLYLDAAQKTFYSILKTDVHNTGAFSTNEQAVGSPFKKGAIESCCVIAYNALGVEIYKLTGDSKIVDFLEQSLYNACFGMWSPSGRWSTYDTPMDGERLANTTSIQFQSRPGSPELNCCSVNAPRAVGMLSEWAFTEKGDRLCVNAYEAGTYVTEDGATVEITGQYPFDNVVTLNVKGGSGKLALRIPAWSTHTVLVVDGKAQAVTPGTYAEIDYQGNAAVRLTLDFSTRFLKGQDDFADLTSVYRGPLLYGVDTTACGEDLNNLPPINAGDLLAAKTIARAEYAEIPLPNGVILYNFAHLGTTGGKYRTWLPIDGNAE